MSHRQARKKRRCFATKPWAESRQETGKKQAAKEESKRVFFAPEGHRRLTINVTHEMHKKLRLMAVEQDTTITDILTKLVAKELG